MCWFFIREGWLMEKLWRLLEAWCKTHLAWSVSVLLIMLATCPTKASICFKTLLTFVQSLKCWLHLSWLLIQWVVMGHWYTEHTHDCGSEKPVESVWTLLNTLKFSLDWDSVIEQNAISLVMYTDCEAITTQFKKVITSSVVTLSLAFLILRWVCDTLCVCMIPDNSCPSGKGIHYTLSLLAKHDNKN